jgi:hypothetical protein
MSLRKSKLELQNLKDVVAPNRAPGTYFRIEGENEGEGAGALWHRRVARGRPVHSSESR